MSAEPAQQRGNVSTCINSVSQATNHNERNRNRFRLTHSNSFLEITPGPEKKTAPEESGSGLQFGNNKPKSFSQTSPPMSIIKTPFR